MNPGSTDCSSAGAGSSTRRAESGPGARDTSHRDKARLARQAPPLRRLSSVLRIASAEGRGHVRCSASAPAILLRQPLPEKPGESLAQRAVQRDELRIGADYPANRRRDLQTIETRALGKDVVRAGARMMKATIKKTATITGSLHTRDTRPRRRR